MGRWSAYNSMRECYHLLQVSGALNHIQGRDLQIVMVFVRLVVWVVSGR